MNIKDTIRKASQQGAHRPFADAPLKPDAEYLADLETEAQSVGSEFDSESIEQGDTA